MGKKEALKAIRDRGILLVYPIHNAGDPPSLWHALYPRSRMRWEWDEEGDDRVARLWHLREELSRSRRVIYTKWYRGRATFFSTELFQALYARFERRFSLRTGLSRESRELLAILEESSPRSPKELKRECALVGRALEPQYQRALKELWQRLLIVGYGEIAEGAFPSLAIGASSLLFEDILVAAREMPLATANEIVFTAFRGSPKLQRFLESVERDLLHHAEARAP
jgi:hypothetical protein